MQRTAIAELNLHHLVGQTDGSFGLTDDGREILVNRRILGRLPQIDPLRRWIPGLGDHLFDDNLALRLDCRWCRRRKDHRPTRKDQGRQHKGQQQSFLHLAPHLPGISYRLALLSPVGVHPLTQPFEAAFEIALENLPGDQNTAPPRIDDEIECFGHGC